MSKKTIIIISGVFVLVLVAIIAAALYFASKKQEDAATPTDQASFEGREITVPIERKVFILSMDPVVSPVLAADGSKVRYYTKSNGNVFEVDFEGGAVTKISSIPISGILEAKWFPKKEQAIVVAADLDGTKKLFFDYRNKKTITYNKNTQNIAFSPDGEKIAYQFTDDFQKINNISVANPDSSDWNTVFNTRFRDLKIDWVTGSKIALIPPSSGLVENAVYTLNPSNGSFGKILGGIYGLTVLWSPAGNSFIYSATDSKGKNLSLNFLNESGEPKDLGFGTLAEKCVFSTANRYAVCAVPREISGDAVLPDDYYKNKITTEDEIWKIGLDGSFSAAIFTAEDMEGYTFDVQDPILTPDENYFVFVNKKDGLLYSIKLY